MIHTMSFNRPSLCVSQGETEVAEQGGRRVEGVPAREAPVDAVDALTEVVRADVARSDDPAAVPGVVRADVARKFFHGFHG